MNRDYAMRQKFCEYLINRVVGNMSGANSDGVYCKHNKPSDVFSIGSLSPVPTRLNETEDNEFYTEFLARYAPYSMGMEFIGNINNASNIEIQISFNVYYRVIPSYMQQCEVQGIKHMATVFKRKEIKNVTFIISANDLLEKRSKSFHFSELKEVKSALDRVYLEILNDEDTFRSNRIKFTDKSISSEIEYKKTLEGLKDKVKIIPQWDLEIHAQIQNYQNDHKYVQIMIVNKSNNDNFNSNIYEDYLFDVELSVGVSNGEIKPFIFNLLEDSYRFERDMWGIGINCSVTRNSDREILVTENSPVYQQLRYGTRDFMPGKQHIPIQQATFNQLKDNPIPILEKFKEQMEEYKEYCLNHKDEYINQFGRKSTEDDLFNSNIEEFQQEIDRFNKGIQLLKKSRSQESKYHIIYKAFSYMNETYAEMLGNKNILTWRTFQIVFIVSHLIDIVGQHWVEDFKQDNNIEKISVLWFPTGGGKTEAYLGLVIFNLFFDRLRGKQDGVTALFRFPLRILSLQQFQRIFNILMSANQIMSKYNIRGKLFSIGHWVGNNQTPNNIETKNSEWEGDIQALKNRNKNSKEWNNAQEKLKRVSSCPMCGSKIEVEWSNKLNTIVHRCNNNTCDWSYGLLPIYITDTDMYRYLPSLIVSTVDKIAVAGMQAKFSNLLGDVYYYSNEKGYSWVKFKDLKDYQEISDDYRKLLRPTLLIQDELHLLKEDLGVYDSHYESTVQEMLKRISGNYAWKIICSTATIQDYNRHISHLYGRKEKDRMAIRFPVEGPKSDESFYTVKSDDNTIGRYYVGVMGHNKTHINTIVDVIYNFHKEIKELRQLEVNEFVSRTNIIVVNEEKKNEILDDYEISLNYVLTKRNADQVAESINSQIADYLADNELSEINNEMLTGGTTPDKLSTVLNKIEKEYKKMNKEERITSITATSMISHGIDVDRFNFMIFFGMPRQTSEYIQASSRIGRTLPGITFIVFAPQKERDQSYYKYFHKYHQYLDRLVEVPAINRWSKFSIDKTFTGIMLAHILSKYNRQYQYSLYKTDFVKRYLYPATKKQRDVVKQDFLKQLKKYYATEHEEGDRFVEVIEENIERFFDSLRRYQNEFIPDHMKTVFGNSPMRSLRDTEEEIPFLKSYRLRDVNGKLNI